MKLQKVLFLLGLFCGIFIITSDSSSHALVVYNAHNDRLPIRSSESYMIRMPVVSSTEDNQELLTERSNHVLLQSNQEDDEQQDDHLLTEHQVIVRSNRESTTNQHQIPENATVVEVPVRARREFGFWETIGFIYVGTIISIKLVDEFRKIYDYWDHQRSDNEFPTFDHLEAVCCLGGLATLGKIYTR